MEAVSVYDLQYQSVTVSGKNDTFSPLFSLLF